MAHNNMMHGWNTWSVSDNRPCSAADQYRNYGNYPPNFRYWEGVNNTFKRGNGKEIVFRVMSYNILAQILLEFHSYLYADSSPNALVWDTRFHRIYNEIIAQHPAIICLQELQFDHVEFLDSFLRKHDYKFIYKQRTGIRVDGCAIFYKASMFNLIDHQSVEFCQPKTDLLNRDNIGLMAKFRSKLMPSIPIVVCTTHLLYNPKRTDVRLAQMQVFLAEIDRFSYDMKTTSHGPVILTGDFNSFPDSPVVKLLSEGRADLQRMEHKLKNISITYACQHLGVYLQRHKDQKLKEDDVSRLYHSEKIINLDSDEDDKDIKKSVLTANDYDSLFSKTFVKHTLKLKSVYNFYKPDGQREVTTHQDDWVTVDYIFYSSGNGSNLELTERYHLPSEKECLAIGAIPNEQFGSDHFSLAAGFILKPKLPRSSV